MKKIIALLLSFLCIFGSVGYAESSSSFDVSNYTFEELLEIRAIIDLEIERQASLPATTLIPGRYVVGRDIVAGVYSILGLMDDGPGGYTPQVLLAESLDDAESRDYIDYEYSTWKKMKSGALAFLMAMFLRFETGMFLCSWLLPSVVV